MAAIASSAAVVLALVFAWAAVAKITAPERTVRSFTALAVPMPNAAAKLVPGAEVALTAGLIVAPAIAGWAAFALIAAFTIVLARAMARGVREPCSCFGSARAEPVSSAEIVRNALLAALAIVATGATASPVTSPPGLAAVIVTTVAFALGRVALAVLAFRRETGRLWPRLPGAGA